MLHQKTAVRGDELRQLDRLEVHRSVIRSAQVPFPRTFVGRGVSRRASANIVVVCNKFEHAHLARAAELRR